MAKRVIGLMIMSALAFFGTLTILEQAVVYGEDEILSCASRGCPGNASCAGGGQNNAGYACIFTCDDECTLNCGPKK